jgi:dipeptidyl aminopeptidase/acylaminoacyl peptidase
MKARWILSVGIAVLLSVALAGAALPPLIPREVLFGNPVKSGPQISPDGTRLSYMAPSDKGVMNVWVRTIGKSDDTQVTNDTYRGIRAHFWAYDGKHLLYLQDIGGDENFHVYSVDLATKVVRDLTPFQGIRAQGINIDKDHPNEMLVGLNLRDRRAFDMYRVDLTTGALALDTQNPGDVVGWITDADFKIRGANARNPSDGSTTLRVRDTAGAPFRDLVVWPFGENGGGVAFTKDGKDIYAQTSLGADTARAVKLDAATGKEAEVIASHPKADIADVLVHPDTRVVQAVAFNYLKNEWQVLDPSIKADFEALAKMRRGEFYVGARDNADKTWIVTYQTDDGPVAYYAYHRDTKQADFLFVNRPAMEQLTLARMEPKVIKARDGFDLVSYLTLPPGVEPRNLPLVLNVHGGPWARDGWGFNPEAQWLANRGYAVLQVNFRGSRGFGKKFLNAGNVQWGVGTMQHDLTDAVKWAVAEGISRP